MNYNDYYDNVYVNRLNRYGNNYQQRIMTQRREVFRRRLEKSVYRIDFNYRENAESEFKLIPATFERFKQDNTQTLRYLFTEYDVKIPNGTVLYLPDPIGTTEDIYVGPYPLENVQGGVVIENSGERGEGERPWMVYYLEDNGAKGYNRYIMLRMTHYIQWKDRDKQDRESYAYMYGQENNMLKDEIRSRSRMDTIYGENLKTSFFVMPANEYLRKDIYLEIDHEKNNKKLDEYYRVTGYDIQSQDGVEYVTIDPIYEYAPDYYDEIPKPELIQDQGETEEEFAERQKEQDNDFFWLQGG